MSLVFLPPSRPLVARAVGVLAWRAGAWPVWSWGQPRRMVRSSRATAEGWSSCTQRSRSAVKLGSRRPAVTGGIEMLHAHRWLLWLLGIPCQLVSPAWGANASVGLDEREDFTASGAQPREPRQLRSRAQDAMPWAREPGWPVSASGGSGRGSPSVVPGRLSCATGSPARRRSRAPWAFPGCHAGAEAGQRLAHGEQLGRPPPLVVGVQQPRVRMARLCFRTSRFASEVTPASP